MKLIHLTDPHLVAPGQSLFGLDPAARLRAAVASIVSTQRDADLVVLTGDLAHRGEAPAYRALRTILGELPMPVVPLLGNHDDRAGFQAVFDDAPCDEDGFVQGSRRVGDWRLVFVDTNQPGTHAGWLCEQRLASLARRLASGTEPVMLFMHHPPFDVGLAPMDRIGLVQKAAFREVVAPHAHRIRHLFYGHVHRPIFGSWHGIATSTVRATSHQVWLDFEAQGAIPGSHEPPAYGIVLADAKADTVVVHLHDFLDDSPKFALEGQDPR